MWPSYQGWRTHLSLCLIRRPSRGKRWRQQPRVGGNRCLLTRSTVGHTAVPQSIINRLNTGWQCASFNRSSKIIKIEKNISPCGLPETTYIKYRNSNSWRISWPAQIRRWWLVAEQQETRRVTITWHFIVLLLFTLEIFLILLQVWASFYPVCFQAFSFFVFVFFGSFLFMLAIGELLVIAHGGFSVRRLGGGCSRSCFSPLRFGNRGWPAEFVWRVQTVWAPLKMIVGFVKLCFNVSARVSMTRGATSPIGAKVSMGGRLQRLALV